MTIVNDSTPVNKTWLYGVIDLKVKWLSNDVVYIYNMVYSTFPRCGDRNDSELEIVNSTKSSSS